MFTGSIYIVTTILLVLIMRYGSKEPHQVLDTEDIFRYPKVVRYIIMIGIPVWLVAIIVARLTARPDIDTPMMLNIGTMVFVLISIANTIIAVYYNRYYLAVTSSEIRWGGFKIRSLLFREMSKIEVRKMEKGRTWLIFYELDGHSVLKVTNDLQDFDDLVDLMRQYGKKAGVEFIMR